MLRSEGRASSFPLGHTGTISPIRLSTCICVPTTPPRWKAWARELTFRGGWCHPSPQSSLEPCALIFSLLKKCKRQRESERASSYPLVHCPDAHDGQGWARMKPGIPSRSPRLVAEIQLVELSPLPSRVCISGRLDSGAGAGTPLL